ncbi:hypothetical protein NS226_01555 [Aureimonas ureilytica]|uniref:Peptidase S8/S53 domain-containing protein n=1 Tax=Aureimonas ureilytica TaxID=401562 RepID=A0A175RE29_9HYPH|nr:S8 family peptidase [Aureimonas ureilytica]KTQ98254.1 hypothetical protein NS226_01555 [Aureimonas ureilytica]
MGDRFDSIRRALEDSAELPLLTPEANAIAPERAIVIVVRGAVRDFAAEARRVGLFWLAEDLAEEDLGQDGYDDSEEGAPEADLDEDADEAEMEPVLYVSMPTADSLTKLLELWDKYTNKEKPPATFSEWWKIFGRLTDLRAWGPKDRIAEETRSYIRRKSSQAPQTRIHLEFDLWFREGKVDRERRARAFKAFAERSGAIILDEAVIDAINYHGLLLSVLPAAATALVEFGGPLAFADEVMSIRPQSLASFLRDEAVDTPTLGRAVTSDGDDRDPVIAVIDGFPVENHPDLAGHIDVMPLDVDASAAPSAKRVHGTRMASLILHGDLQDQFETTLPRRLAMVPILGVDSHGLREQTPSDKLAIKLVHRAILSLKSGVDGAEALAPGILVVNHSLCNENAPFTRRPSQWARLLDHLMFDLGILVVLSAGNIESEFTVARHTDLNGFRRHDPAERRIDLIKAIHESRESRRLLTPAESLNGLTVGALHADGSTEAAPGSSIDPYLSGSTPALCSAVGPGVSGAVKPDFLVPGGRQIAQARTDAGIRVRARSIDQLGHLTAAPSPSAAASGRRGRGSGTSNSTALTTRALGWMIDALDSVIDLPDEQLAWSERPARAALLKALVLHGCSWGALGEELDRVLPPADNRRVVKRRQHISQLIGHGVADFGKSVTNGARHVTLVADGTVKPNKRNEYRFPLPAGLSSVQGLRRITMTLAWMTPVRQRALDHRAVQLALTGPDGKKPNEFWDGALRKASVQPPYGSSRKGTVSRIVLEGEKVMLVEDNETILIGVQARSTVTSFNQLEIPYGLVVSMEVGENVRSDIYEQVLQAVQVQNRERIEAEAARAREKAARARERVRPRTRK